MTHFTEEEKLIISMFQSNGRLITVSKIRAAMADVDDEEMLELMQSTAEKLLFATVAIVDQTGKWAVPDSTRI